MTDILPVPYTAGNIPVFRPTMEQFKDFYKFIKSINKYGMQAGIVKIIPPQEWLIQNQSINQQKASQIKIRHPITQNVNGSKGVYIFENMEKNRNYNLKEWKKLALSHRPPKQRGTSPVNLKKTPLESGKGNSLFTTICEDNYEREFTTDRCAYLETVYWKSLSYSTPMYGADSLGSLFDDSCNTWNVSRLPNLLDNLQEKIPGVNDAYLYAGLWKASFAWHLEDQDLYSINYIHFGAPKQWYSIPQEDADKFYKLMCDIFPENARHCSEFLRHKTFMCSPSFLEAKGIRVNKTIHYEKEFIVTYPYGYHAGFNYDYNLAESVNFAIDEWLPLALKAKKCECISDSVGIDVKRLIREMQERGDNEAVNSIQLTESNSEAAESSTEGKLNRGKQKPKRKRRKSLVSSSAKPHNPKLMLRISKKHSVIHRKINSDPLTASKKIAASSSIISTPILTENSLGNIETSLSVKAGANQDTISKRLRTRDFKSIQMTGV